VSRPDHATLQNLGLDPFLFAEVGTEANGSTLTMLSLLARLGQDPWVEAARWAKLPKAAATESLIQVISGVPLVGRTISDTRAVAARLVLLLPTQEWLPDSKSIPMPRRTTVQAFGNTLRMTAMQRMPRWLPMALLACALVIGVALNLVHPVIGGGGNASHDPTPSKAQAQTTDSR
jgi:hypothetical protein